MKYYFGCDKFRMATKEEEHQIGFENVKMLIGRTIFPIEAADRTAAFAAAKARADAEIPIHGEVRMMASFDVYPKLLEQAMQDKGMTVRGLADAAGVSPNIISGLRTGSRKPQAETLRRIADALGTTMDELWPSLGK